MFKRLWTTLMVAAIGLAGFAGSTSAATVIGAVDFTGNYGNLTGTGNGPVLGVLSLQEQGNNTYEWGTSGWNGTTETWSTSTSQVHTNTTPSGYYAQSVGALAAFGINASNLALVFQVNVANGGTDLSVTHFFVDFIDGATGSVVTSLEYHPDSHSVIGTDINALNGTTTDNGVLPGVGQGSSGWLYTLDLSGVPVGFFSNLNNRIGMHVVGSDITQTSDMFNVNDGSDNFFFTSFGAGPPPPVVPVPAAAWTGISALVGMGVFGKLRKKLRGE